MKGKTPLGSDQRRRPRTSKKNPAQVLGIVSFGLDALANQIANDTSLRRVLSLTPGVPCGPFSSSSPQQWKLRSTGSESESGGGLFRSLILDGSVAGSILFLAPNPSDGRLELLTVDPVPKHHAIRVLARVLAMRKV